MTTEPLYSFDAKLFDDSYFEDAFKNSNFSSTILVDLSGKIKVNEEEPILISGKKIKQDLQSFVLMV